MDSLFWGRDFFLFLNQLHQVSSLEESLKMFVFYATAFWQLVISVLFWRSTEFALGVAFLPLWAWLRLLVRWVKPLTTMTFGGSSDAKYFPLLFIVLSDDSIILLFYLLHHFNHLCLFSLKQTFMQACCCNLFFKMGLLWKISSIYFFSGLEPPQASWGITDFFFI